MAASPLWTLKIFDVLIALNDSSIAISLIHLVWRRRHLRFGGMFVWFCVLAVACGTTLIINVWSSWSPPSWLSAVIKVIAAMVAIPTAVSETLLQASFQGRSKPSKLRKRKSGQLRASSKSFGF
jgi:hypothetical protein